MMHKILATLSVWLLLALASAVPASAQCSGQFPANKVCGNATGSLGLPGAVSITPSMFGAIPAGSVIGNNTGSAAVPSAVRNINLGVPGSFLGSVGLAGSTSGLATIAPQVVAGTPTLLLPTTSGTLPSNASLPIVLDPVTGNISCPTCGGSAPSLTSAHLFVGNGSNVATDVAVSGDLTLANTGAFTFNTVNANTGAFGSATAIPVITVNAKGLITGVTTAAPTVTAVNGVSYPAAPYVIGDLLQASSTTGMARLAAVATGNALISGGVGTVSSWGKIGLATHVSGNLPVANLNSGTGASGTTFWAGDGTWKAPSGSGTVNSGTAGQFGYYAGTGTAISGNPNATISSGAMTLGQTGSVAGSLVLAGSTSGAVTQTAQAAAGTPTITWGTASGTPATSMPAPLSLSATTGAVAWAGLNSGGVLYASGTTSVSSSAALTANLPVIGGGAGVAPTVGTRSGNTTAYVTTTGTQTSGNCVSIDASGNHIASGGACTGTAFVDDFVAGVGFTPGTSTTVTLSNAPSSKQALHVYFDGVVQAQNTWSLSTTTVTFTQAIPAQVQVVEAQYYSASSSSGARLPGGVVTPAVVADAQFIFNGSITSGLAVLTSSSNLFVAGDVGKTINCGIGSTLLTTTILSFQSAGQVTLNANAAATATAAAWCQWGTDNTTVINNAITGLTQGGTVLLPTGNIMVSSINMANSTSVSLVGAGCAINAPNKGTVFYPITSSANRPVLDLTGAQGATVSCMQIGSTNSPVAPGAGILIANSNTMISTLFKIDQVFITGTFRVASIYQYAGQDSIIQSSQIWNYNTTIFGQASGQLAIYITRDNQFSMGSAYTTIATGDQATGNVILFRVEAHDYKPGGGATSGSALWMRGGQLVSLYAGQYDSSTSTAGVITFEQSTAGVNNSRFTSFNSTFYTENGTTPASCLAITTGTVASATILNPGYTCTATRTGTIPTYVGFSVP